MPLREVLMPLGWGFGGFCEVKRTIFGTLGLCWGMMSLGANTTFLAFCPCRAPLVFKWAMKPIFVLIPGLREVQWHGHYKNSSCTNRQSGRASPGQP